MSRLYTCNAWGPSAPVSALPAVRPVRSDLAESSLEAHHHEMDVVTARGQAPCLGHVVLHAEIHAAFTLCSHGTDLLKRLPEEGDRVKKVKRVILGTASIIL